MLRSRGTRLSPRKAKELCAEAALAVSNKTGGEYDLRERHVRRRLTRIAEHEERSLA